MLKKNILDFFLPAFLKVAFRARNFKIREFPFIASGSQRNNMVHMEAVFTDFFSAFHADTAIADVHDLTDAIPVRAHEEISQTTRTAKGMLAESRFAAHAAKEFPLVIFTPGESLFIRNALAVTHFLSLMGCSLSTAVKNGRIGGRLPLSGACTQPIFSKTRHETGMSFTGLPFASVTFVVITGVTFPKKRRLNLYQIF
jgi:hypothetical protein